MKPGIVAFAYGVPASLWSNTTIAAIAAHKAKEMGGAPVFTQRDIQFDPHYWAPDDVTECLETPGDPPPSLRIAREAVGWAVSRGLDTLEISAARPHLWRCLRDLRYAIDEVGADIEVRPCEAIEDFATKDWFRPESTQSRVRSVWAWWPREIVLRLMPMFLYKRVAS